MVTTLGATLFTIGAKLAGTVPSRGIGLVCTLRRGGLAGAAPVKESGSTVSPRLHQRRVLKIVCIRPAKISPNACGGCLGTSPHARRVLACKIRSPDTQAHVATVCP